MSEPTAREVANVLERRRRRRRVGVLGMLAALVAAAAMYLRCGSGWGLGGTGNGAGPAAIAGSADVHRCALKVTAAGIVVDGKPMTRDDAVAACKAVGGAVVTVAGNAREGDWIELEHALDDAHVPIDRRGR